MRIPIGIRHENKSAEYMSDFGLLFKRLTAISQFFNNFVKEHKTASLTIE